jgi:hypothetical protein
MWILSRITRRDSYEEDAKRRIVGAWAQWETSDLGSMVSSASALLRGVSSRISQSIRNTLSPSFNPERRSVWALAWATWALALAWCSSSDDPEVALPDKVALWSINVPKDVVAGKEIVVEFQYVPWLPESPSVTLDGAPVWVKIGSQLYDPASGRMKVTLDVSPWFDINQVIDASIVSSITDKKISIDPLRLTIAVKPGEPQLLVPLNPVIVKQGWIVNMKVAFDRPIDIYGISIPWIDLNNAPGIVLDPNTNTLTLEFPVPVNLSTGNLKGSIDVVGRWEMATKVPFDLNILDGNAPKLLNPAQLSGEWAQWEPRTVRLIFDEAVSQPIISCDDRQFSLWPINAVGTDRKIWDVLVTASQNVGSKQFSITASDDSGNNGVIYLTSEVVDKIAPVISLSVRPTAISSNSASSFEVTTTEPLSALGYYLNDDVAMTQVDPTIWKFSVNWREWSNTVRIVSMDRNGNPSEPITHTWFVDTKAPELNISSQTTINADRLTEPATYTWNLTFDGPVKAEWSSQSGSGISLGTITGTGTNTLQYGIQISPEVLPGRYPVTVSVNDTAWNKTLVDIQVLVNAPTTVSAISGPDTFVVGETPAYSITATDADGKPSVGVTLRNASGGQAQVDLIDIGGGVYSISMPANLPVWVYTLNFGVKGKKPDGSESSESMVSKSINVTPQVPQELIVPPGSGWANLMANPYRPMDDSTNLPLDFSWLQAPDGQPIIYMLEVVWIADPENNPPYIDKKSLSLGKLDAYAYDAQNLTTLSNGTRWEKYTIIIRASASWLPTKELRVNIEHQDTN